MIWDQKIRRSDARYRRAFVSRSMRECDVLMGIAFQQYPYMVE